MNNKKIGLGIGFLMLSFLMVGTAAAANFEVQNKSGTVLMRLDPEGTLNVTTGKIAEEGQFLEDIYCKLTGGCSLTGDVTIENLNVTGWLDIGDDRVQEGALNLTTSCPAGSHLYIDNGNFACEADLDTTLTLEGPFLYDNGTHGFFNETYFNESVNALIALNPDTDTLLDLQGPYLYNTSTQGFLNETVLNATIDARAALTGFGTLQQVTDAGATTTNTIQMTGGNVDMQGGNVTSTTADLVLTSQSNDVVIVIG